MVLTMREKQAITREMACRYRQADRKAKGAILDQVMSVTGYNRCYATQRLRDWGRRELPPAGAGEGSPTELAGGSAITNRRARPRVYENSGHFLFYQSPSRLRRLRCRRVARGKLS